MNEYVIFLSFKNWRLCSNLKQSSKENIFVHCGATIKLFVALALFRK